MILLGDLEISLYSVSNDYDSWSACTTINRWITPRTASTATRICYSRTAVSNGSTATATWTFSSSVTATATASKSSSKRCSSIYVSKTRNTNQWSSKCRILPTWSTIAYVSSTSSRSTSCSTAAICSVTTERWTRITMTISPTISRLCRLSCSSSSCITNKSRTASAWTARSTYILWITRSATTSSSSNGI